MAGIQSQIDALNEGLLGIASSEELEDVSTNLVAVQEELQDFLSANNIYSSDLYINNETTLNLADALGDRLHIVNGHVEIYATPEMDSTTLQAVVNRINTVVGNFGYLSQGPEVGRIHFDSIVSTNELHVGVPHAISFANLANSGDIHLGTNFVNSVDAIDFGSLRSAGTISSETLSNEANNLSGNRITRAFTETSSAHTIAFDRATVVNLGSLPYYTAAQLTIQLDSGGDLSIGALENADAAGNPSTLDLSITGAAEVNLPHYTDGIFTATDIGRLSLPVYTGASGHITLSNVAHISLGAIEKDVAIGYPGNLDNRLETLAITAAKGADEDDTAPSIAVYSTSLTEASVAGVTAAITIENSPSLVTASITAKASAAIRLVGNPNLQALSLGGEAPAVVIENNARLESLNIETTSVRPSSVAPLDGLISVKDNASLSSLTILSNDIEFLTITGNDNLTTLDLSALTRVGETGHPRVQIYDNDLRATLITDESDGDSDAHNGANGDHGSIASDSGMDTAKTYLAAVAAHTAAAANVFFDTVDEFVNSEGTAPVSSRNLQYNPAMQTNPQEELIVLQKVAPHTPAVAAISATHGKHSWIIPSDAGTLQIISGDPWDFLLRDNEGEVEAVTIHATNPLISLHNLSNSNNYASLTGIRFSAQVGGHSSVSIIPKWISSYTQTPRVVGERHTTIPEVSAAIVRTNHGFGTDEVITFSVGSNTVTTTSATGVQGNSESLRGFLRTIESAYAAKYGPSGTASASAVASLTVSTSGDPILEVRGLDPGSRGHNLAVSLSVEAGTATATNGLALDWIIGGTNAPSDNHTASKNIIITIESETAGPLSDASDALIYTDTGSPTRLVSTADTENETTAYEAQQESRADVRNARAASAATPALGGSSYSRIAWL